MIFNDHSTLKGKHAILGASKHAWLSDSDDKLLQRYLNSFSTEIGTAVHEYACKRIERRLQLLDNISEKNALLMHLLDSGIPWGVIDIDRLFCNLVPYVNDAIGYKMTPELILYYSDLSYGTADALSYSRNTLRIHDLKTGTTPADMDQLMIYAGWFYLEYKKQVNFQKSKTELRIYQNQEVLCYTPTNQDISGIMEKIVHGSVTIENNISEV